MSFSISRLQSLSKQFASKYVFSTAPFSEINSDLFLLFQSFYTCLIELLKICFGLVVCFALVLVKLLILLLPHALKLSKQVYQFHKGLSYYDVLIEFTFLSIVVFGYLFRKTIQNWWTITERNISAKSKALALALPHILFFSSSFIISILGQKFIAPLTSPKIMPVFTLIIPLANLVYLIRRDVHVDGKHIQRYNHVFTTLVVLGIYHSIVTCLSTIPFSNYFLSFLPYIKETIIVILVWVQVSSVFAQIVFTSAIKPVMSKISGYLPFGNTTIFSDQDLQNNHDQAALANKRSVLDAVIRFFNVFSEQQLEYFSFFLRDSLVSMLAFLFLCLPYPFSYLGMVAISFILPCFRCVSLVNHLSLFRLEMIRTNNHHHHRVHHHQAVEQENHQPINQEQQQIIMEQKKQLLNGNVLRWIHYWICILGIWIFRIYVCSIWSTIIILVSFWLQHAYFKGAITIVSTVASYFKVFYSDRKPSRIIDVNGASNNHGTALIAEPLDELFQPVPDETGIILERQDRERESTQTPTLISRRTNAMEDGDITDSDSRNERSEISQTNPGTNNVNRNKTD
jgi:hypothetical protein